MKPQEIANTYQSKKQPINIRRGEGGWEWMGAAFIAFMVARRWGCDRVPPRCESREQDVGDYKGPPRLPSSTLAPTV